MNFLVKKSIGLDIDDRSLALVELSGNTNIKLTTYGKVALESGLIKNGVICDEDQVKAALTQLIGELSPKSVKVEKIVFGLPHSQLYSVIVEVVVADDKNLKDSIYQVAATNLPFDSNDLLLTYKIISQQASSYQVLLIGTSRKLIVAWQKLLADLGVEIVLFDISSYALLRDAADIDVNQHNAVIDVGLAKTNFFVFHQGNLIYSHDIEIGGQTLTDNIARQLNMELALAEEKKLSLGLNRQLYPILASTLEELSKEINASLSEYERMFGQTVAKIFLVGGGANLKGLSNYLMETVYVPNANISLASINSQVASEYVEACGLALRGLDLSRYSNEPYLDLSEKVPGVIAVSGSEETESGLYEEVNVGKQTKDLDIQGLQESADIDKGLSEEVRGAGNKKLAFEKKLLLVIIVVGLLAIIGAYRYRELGKKQMQNGSVDAVVTYNKIQTFPFKVAIATEDGVYANDKARGRIINDVAESANDFNEAVNLSRRDVSKDLSVDEELWTEPLNEIIDKNKIVYPMTLRWLAFNKQEVLELALLSIDQLNSAGIPYAFNDIKKTKLEKSDVLGVVYVYGQISISLNQEIAVSQTIDLGSSASSSESALTNENLASSSESLINKPANSNNTEDIKAVEDTVMPDMITVRATETGWLNVREGAGKNFAIVTKVYPGDSFKVLAQAEGWYQITLTDGRQGWILASYTKRNE